MRGCGRRTDAEEKKEEEGKKEDERGVERGGMKEDGEREKPMRPTCRKVSVDGHPYMEQVQCPTARGLYLAS